MLLKSACVQVFKSIDNSDVVPIDPEITVLVGQNEAGKTAFLQALHKARPVDKDITYDVVEEYPRKGLNRYMKDQHESDPAVVVVLTYTVQDTEIQEIDSALGFHLVDKLEFSLNHKYDGKSSVGLSVPEEAYVGHLVATTTLPAEVVEAAKSARTVQGLISALEGLDLNTEATTFLTELKERFASKGATGWSNLLALYIWRQHLQAKLPKFLYFDDYYLLPGKKNLTQLQQRVRTHEQNGGKLEDADKTVLSLLRMAGVDIDDLTDAKGYESIKARLESISNDISDKVFEYWTQNPDLEVQFDIRADPNDQPPYNTGSNLYIRIFNRRHRVSVPFSHRSRGFIWFFSFIVWFDSIKQQLDTATEGGLVLLLDEPGLSLHALAQADLLLYIDELAKNHQILYTTHSPLMVHGDRLHQVRTVEDRIKEGTKITEHVMTADAKTLFPLQAALGYTIAQNLFISKRNLLVEGPADLIYLKFFSNLLEQAGRTGLREDVMVVPVGGLDKIATFVALLGANELEMAVLHDFESKPDPRLETLVRDKLIRDRQVLHYGMFRSAGSASGARVGKQNTNTPPAASAMSSDVEDLFSPALYLTLFNNAYKDKLTTPAKETDLTPGDRIVVRINGYLKDNGIQLRPSGGFNHYLVAPAGPQRSRGPAACQMCGGG